jgi:hypothetical protein
MQIKRIEFNPPGPDDRSHPHLNREYVYLVNTGDKPVQLNDWKVIDHRGRRHVYWFTSKLYMDPGDTIHLRTGHGSDGAPACEIGKPCPEHAHYDMHWELDHFVWNNHGDRVTVKNNEGVVIDRCWYSRDTDSPKRC